MCWINSFSYLSKYASSKKTQISSFLLPLYQNRTVDSMIIVLLLTIHNCSIISHGFSLLYHRRKYLKSKHCSRKLSFAHDIVSRHKHIEKELHKQCVNELQLAALHKDDSVSPDLMTACLRRLLKYRTLLAPHLYHAHLQVTNYYSILSDGQICIPWDFKL